MPVGKVLAIFGWLCLVFAGLGEGFSPGGNNRPVLGVALLVAAGVIFLWTMSLWAKIFPALCSFAAFMSTVAIFTGRSLGPDSPMSHAQAVLGMVVFGSASFFTLRFRAKDFVPQWPDRLATLTLVSGIFWQAVDTRVTSLAFALGFFALFAAWLVDRLKRRQHHGYHKSPSG